MKKSNNFCEHWGGLKNFSARKTFPGLKKYFDFNERVWAKSCEIASSIQTLEADDKDQEEAEEILLWKGTTAHLTWKALKTSLATQNLLEKGFLEDSYCLIRSLLESYITLEYIDKDVSGRIKLFVEYYFVHKNRLRQAYNKIYGMDVNSYGDSEKQLILDWQEAEYKRVKDNYPVKSAWSPVKIFEMAREVGYENAYHLIYSHLCQFTHATVNTGNSYIKEGDKEGLKIVIEPNTEDEKKFEMAIHLATSYIIIVIEVFDRVFQTGYSEELENISEEFKTLYSMQG